MEQEEADVIKRIVSETRPGGNGYPYSYNLLRFQGVDRSSCLRNTRCILIIRTSMTVRAELSSPATISKSPLSLFSFVFFTPFATLREGKKLLKRWTRLFDALPPSFIIIIFRARMFTRRFEFFRNRNEEMFVISIIISLKFTLDIFTYNFLLFSCPVYLCK